jgi:hypothetical protein
MVDPMVARIIGNRFAAQIHEGLGLHQHSSPARCDLGIPLRLEAKRYRHPARKFVENHKASVVASPDELPARVAEADDETKNGRILHARERAGYFFGSPVASDSSAFFSLMTSGATASSASAAGSSATVGSDTRKTVRSSSGTAVTPGGSLISRT